MSGSELNDTRGKIVNNTCSLTSQNSRSRNKIHVTKERRGLLHGTMQECFPAQNSVRVRKHRQEMLYSCGEGVGGEIDAEEEWLYWPSDMETGLKWQVSIHQAEKSAFRIFQAEGALHAKAGSQETPVPIPGVKSMMESRGAERSVKKWSLEGGQDLNVRVLLKNSDFTPKAMKTTKKGLLFL